MYDKLHPLNLEEDDALLGVLLSHRPEAETMLDRKAYLEFQQTQFGGWPWPSYEHVHPREKGRFAKYPMEVKR